MNALDRAVIAGVYEHPTRWAPDKTQYQLCAEAARGALADAGLTIADVDGFLTAGVGPIGIMTLAEHLDLKPRFHDATNIGGSSFVAHVLHAAAAIAAGLCETALIVYASTASSERFAVGTGGLTAGDAPDQFEVPYGPTVLNSYALAAQRHMHEFGTTAEQLAEIAVTMRRHAGLNPHAKYRDPITVADVLASRVVSSPLHLLDCCIISDGGGAIVVTSAERARDLPKAPVRILGGSESLCHTAMGVRDLTDMAAKESGPRALAMAGVRHDDVDLCMIYDSFTITVLLTLENLGFCAKGEGKHLVHEGRTALGGDIPINPSGGLKSFGHPIGASGVRMIYECVTQLRGQGGERQIADAEIGLAHNVGGPGAVACVIVLGH